MIEASQTSLSPAGIWVIVIVMTILLAFWLTAIVLADRSQARASGRARLAGDTGPALGGAWAGEAAPQGETPTRADIPAQPATGRHERPGMPRQRSGEGDRAGRSYAGQATPDHEEQDR